VYVFGIIMWLTYGIGIQDYPIISANSITLILTVVILTYKLKYK
jgi:MtN3 and saliva related transmembrane protein